MNLEQWVRNNFNEKFYRAGKNCRKEDITFKGSRSYLHGGEVYYFEANSDKFYVTYEVLINMIDDRLHGFMCDCLDFRINKECTHVAATLINYKDVLVPKPKSIEDYTMELFKQYDEKEEKVFNIKEPIKLELELDLNNNSYKLNVGLNKMYKLNTHNKLIDFYDAYTEKRSYELGKMFTFDYNKHYLVKEDLELLNFLIEGNGKYRYYDTNIFNLSDRDIIYLLDKLKTRKFLLVRFGEVNNIINGIPTELYLDLKDNKYTLELIDFNNYKFVDNSYNYIYYKKTLYIIPNEYKIILSTLKENGIKNFEFKKENLNIFKNGLLNKINNNILLSENIEDVIINVKPNISLYFDINRDIVSCEIKLKYKNTTIDYFDKENNIVRDVEYENELISKLISNNFTIENNKILLKDIDNIGYFISKGIEDFNEYNIYTTEKLDKINVIKESKIRNNFSIGKDGIMSYNFNTDNININELDKVFDSLKRKKKYYKLKNGNIIDLENNTELNELNNIFDDLELSSKDSNGNIIIPKYRAFYIDSLKHNKYKSIDTDNSFNTFINNFKKYRDIDIKLSKEDNKILRDYQKDGVKWLYTIYKCDLGGILADEMGLGKSIQTICFIKQLLKEKEDAKIMIVCPTSLVYNWQKEFEKFGKELKYVVVHEGKEKRKEIINRFDEYNIFITSYGLIRNDNDEYEDKYFELCIIDEAQAIKNYQANMTKEIKKIKAKTKIALTGTPLENSVLELWSIFDFIMPGYLNSIVKFRSLYGIKDVDDESMDRLQKLNYQIKPFILRRKKCDVYKDLPDKIENNIYLDLPDIQKTLYLKELKESKEEIEDLIETEGFKRARFKILQLLMKLRQICVDPNIRYTNYKGESIKIEKLLEIVKDYISEGHKILIFSSFKIVVDRVQELFNKNNITNYMIAGDVKSKTRMELVEKFNNDDTNCFLITLKSGGTGLNLTGADVVIHLDIWWNPQVENQATDRAHRIGQKNKVTVLKLITKGTIEERIIELQNKKKILSENLIEGKNKSDILSSLDEKDIKTLLSMGEDD